MPRFSQLLRTRLFLFAWSFGVFGLLQAAEPPNAATFELLFTGVEAPAIQKIVFGQPWTFSEPRTALGEGETTGVFRRTSAFGSITHVEFLTRPFVMPAEPLRANLDVLHGSAALTQGAYAMVEVISASGRVVGGYEMSNSLIADVDALDHVLTWKGGRTTANLVGETVTLRFVMRDARLYSLHARAHPWPELAKLELKVEQPRLSSWGTTTFRLRGRAADGAFVPLDHSDLLLESSVPSLVIARADKRDVYRGFLTVFSEVPSRQTAQVTAVLTRRGTTLRSNVVEVAVDPAPATRGPAAFKILFLQDRDLEQKSGAVALQANTLQFYAETRGLPTTPRAMAIYSRKIGDRYFVWGSSRLNGEGQLFRASTTDGIHYASEPLRSTIRPDDLLDFTYSPQRDEYLAIERTTRPGPNHWTIHRSKDGLNFTSEGTAYYDHDAVEMVWDPVAAQYVALQVTWQMTDRPRIFPDNIEYLNAHLDNRGRRALSRRTSPNGLHWTPGNRVASGEPGGWQASSVLSNVPDDRDPPDLETYWTDVMRYGDRWLALVMFYTPAAPAFLDAFPYDGPPSKHGPHANTEWMVSDDLQHWERAFRGTQAIEDVRIYFMHEPLELHDRMLFLVPNQTFNGLLPAGIYANTGAYATHTKGAKFGQNLQLYSVPLDRIVGVQGKSGSSFITKLFTAPTGALHLNHRGALRVEVLDANGQVVPGFEKDRGAVPAGDELHRKLTWGSRDTAELAGRSIRLRFDLDDAEVYSVHSW